MREKGIRDALPVPKERKEVMGRPRPGVCRHIYVVEIRNHHPVLVCMYCGKAVP
jgi:hypothetical protein